MKKRPEFKNRNFTVKTILLAMLAAAMIISLTSCGSKSKGFAEAYDRVQELIGQHKCQYDLYCDYDENTDTLTIKIYDDIDFLDELFDELDKSFKDAEIGNLIFQTSFTTSFPDEFLQNFSLRLAALPCKSIRCLGLPKFKLEDDAWTAILDRTEALYQPELNVMAGYSEEGLANLKQVKKLSFSISSDSPYVYDLDEVRILSRLEEIKLTAGLTSERRELTREMLKNINSSGSTVSEYDIAYNWYFFMGLKELGNLKSVLIYPELDGWQPDLKYYYDILYLQNYAPGIYTNSPGEIWHGEEDAGIDISSINVLEHIGDREVTPQILDKLMKGKAADFYEAGQSFAQSSDIPELRGNCLVYMAEPNMYDSQGNPIEEFYTNGSKILCSDSFDSPASPADPVSTFVYIYPEYVDVGYYTDGAVACQTIAMAEFYDMERQVRYDPVIADVAEPLDTIYTDGSGFKKHTAPMYENNILAFLESLQ